MSYTDTLSPKAKANAEAFVKRLNAKGITNPIAQAGILAVVSKESEFLPHAEYSYRNTDNSRIRSIFGKRVAGFTEPQLTALKNDDIAFFDQIYSDKTAKLGLGNNQPGDGFKYRGNGFNQLTGKAQYKAMGNKIGVDLVVKPELLNDITVASDVAIEYFKDRFSSPGNKLALYNSTGLNDFKTVADSTGAYFHANAGWNSKIINSDPTGGKAKALAHAPDLLTFVKQFTGQTVSLAKKKSD